jgi:hypothetical protein
MPRKGATGLSPGFQPWEPENKQFALKGREVSRRILNLLLRKWNAPLRRAATGLYCHIVSIFDLPPLQGASLWVAVPRVKTLG